MIYLFRSLVKDTLFGCDDGELFVEDSINESFLFDDNVLKNSSFFQKARVSD